MNVRYINHTNLGRLGNILYILLHCHKLSTPNSLFKLILSSSCCSEWMIDYNVYKYILNDKVSISKSLITNIKDYKMVIGRDYTENDIMSFMQNTISKGKLFKEYETSGLKEYAKNKVALHVRATDYLLKRHKMYWFNYDFYLKQAFNRFNWGDYELDVYSDDIRYAKKLTEGKLPTDKVTYVDSGDAHKDLLKLAFYPNKIMWNSTFSFWSSYISQFIYGKDNVHIVGPDFYFLFWNNTKPVQYLDNWETIIGCSNG